MTLDLKAIKEQCEAAEEVGANLHHTVVRACIAEIEQLQDVLAQIITKAGDVDRLKWPAVQQEIQAMARKALEGN